MSKARSPLFPSSITVGTSTCRGVVMVTVGSSSWSLLWCGSSRHYLKYEIMVHCERAPASDRVPGLQGDGRAAAIGLRAADLAAPRARALPGRGRGPHGHVAVGGGPLRGG